MLIDKNYNYAMNFFEYSGAKYDITDSFHGMMSN